jgi:hypothetical protein
VVDDEGQDRAACRPGPIGGKHGEGEAVAAAGDGKPQPRRRAKRPERPEKRGELGRAERLAQQPSR